MVSQLSYRDALRHCLQREFTVALCHFRVAVSKGSRRGVKVVRRLGEEALGHSEVVASLLRSLGEQPCTTVESLPVDLDPMTIFPALEAMEQECLELYRQILPLTPITHREEVQRIISEEEEHLRTMRELRNRLNK